MKVTFVNPPFKTEYGKFSRESRSPSIGHSGVLNFPLWMIYAAAVVKEDGFEVEFYDACAKRTDAQTTLSLLKPRIKDSSLFVLGTSTPSIHSDIKFGTMLKEQYPEAFVLLVGTHPSAVPQETMTGTLIDGVARREYDYIVRDLSRVINGKGDLGLIKGLTYRKDGQVISNPDAEYIMELDDIPFASKFIKEYLGVNEYFFVAAAHPSIQIFTGRGCPARCNFCVYPQTMHGHKYRLRSVENVVAEFEYIVKNMPEVKEIVIEDDTFTVNKKRTVEICNLLIEKGLHKKIRWLCNARVNLDLETMKLMKKAGCHLIIPGVESLDQTILNNIRKGTTVEQIERYMENARKARLMVHACYMVGNHGETRETMEATLKAAIKFRTDTAQFFPLIPYPGTQAYDWAKSNGYINGKYEEYCQEDGTLNCIINTPALKASELVEFCAYARKKYYLRPWYIFHRLWKGLFDYEDLKRSLKAFGRLKQSIFRKV